MKRNTAALSILEQPITIEQPDNRMLKLVTPYAANLSKNTVPVLNAIDDAVAELQACRAQFGPANDNRDTILNRAKNLYELAGYLGDVTGDDLEVLAAQRRHWEIKAAINGAMSGLKLWRKWITSQEEGTKLLMRKFHRTTGELEASLLAFTEKNDTRSAMVGLLESLKLRADEISLIDESLDKWNVSKFTYACDLVIAATHFVPPAETAEPIELKSPSPKTLALGDSLAELAGFVSGLGNRVEGGREESAVVAKKILAARSLVTQNLYEEFTDSAAILSVLDEVSTDLARLAYLKSSTTGIPFASMREGVPYIGTQIAKIRQSLTPPSVVLDLKSGFGSLLDKVSKQFRWEA